MPTITYKTNNLLKTEEVKANAPLQDLGDFEVSYPELSDTIKSCCCLKSPFCFSQVQK
jgi:hypothetical protein